MELICPLQSKGIEPFMSIAMTCGCGREAKHASDYEAPLERFIDIDTTGSSVESSLASLLIQLPA